jgi:hypothetical protein
MMPVSSAQLGTTTIRMRQFVSMSIHCANPTTITMVGVLTAMTGMS